MDGARVAVKTATVDSKEDSVVTALAMEYPKGLSAVHFLRLTLTQGAVVMSRNDYVRSVVEGDYRAIRSLAKARVLATTQVKREGEIWRLTTVLQNGRLAGVDDAGEGGARGEWGSDSAGDL